jgi:hypothetical protein
MKYAAPEFPETARLLTGAAETRETKRAVAEKELENFMMYER